MLLFLISVVFCFHFRKLLETKNRTWFLQHHLSTCPLFLHLFWFHVYNMCHIPLAYLQHQKLMFEFVVTYYHNLCGNTYTVIFKRAASRGKLTSITWKEMWHSQTNIHAYLFCTVLSTCITISSDEVQMCYVRTAVM